MKSDSVAFGVAGMAFGLIAGWIIGTEQAKPAQPAARPPPPRRPRARRREHSRRRRR